MDYVIDPIVAPKNYLIGTIHIKWRVYTRIH